MTTSPTVRPRRMRFAAYAVVALLALAGSVDPPVPLPSLYRWASMAGILILAVILSPPVLTRAASLLMRLTGRKTSAELPSYRLIMAFTGLYVIPGLLHGLGLFVLLDSMSGVGAGSYLAITGAYYAASLGGRIATEDPLGPNPGGDERATVEISFQVDGPCLPQNKEKWTVPQDQ